MQKHLLKKVFAILILSIWTFSGGYFGVAGLVHDEEQRKIDALEDSKIDEQIEYDGIDFNSRESLKEYLDQIKTDKWFSWTESIPEMLMLLISSCALGAFGAVVSLLKQIAYDKIDVEETSYVVTPLLGAMLGIVVLAITYIFPTLIVSGEDLEIRPTTLMFLSLLAGMFSKEFLNWLEAKFQNYLSTN